MLQQFQFVDQTNAMQAEIGAFDFNDGSSPDMRQDQLVSAGDTLAVNRDVVNGVVVHDCDFPGSNGIVLSQLANCLYES